MYKNGFVKVMAATPKIVAGNIINNQKEIITTLNNAKASIIVFPELSITGYTASDLFYQEDFLNKALLALKEILKANKHKGIAAIGMPLDIKGGLFNVAVIISGNKILGVVPKYFLPNNQEFSEKRWFISGENIYIKELSLLGQTIPFGNLIFRDINKNIAIGVEICQDLWSIKTPSDDLAMAGANVILNLSASTELINKEMLRRNTVLDHSRKQMVAYVYTTTGIYESSAEALFSSHKIIAALGKSIVESDLLSFEANNIVADINVDAINYRRRQDSNYRDSIFKNEFKYTEVNIELENSKQYLFEKDINKTPFVPNDYELNKTYEILTASLIKKLSSLPLHLRKIVIGVSGGLDSTHALIIAYNAFVKMGLSLNNIYPVIMPADTSTSSSMTDAMELIEGLNLKAEVINIQEAVEKHLKDIEHNKKDTTFENAQARIRTLILMDLANKYEGFVLGTGDLSEIALGWMTYNGDQMSMYAINSGLPKTLIQSLTTYYANNKYKHLKDLLLRIVNKPISPELLKDQVTEDVIGSYKINDFIMYYHLEEGMNEGELIWFLQKAFDINEEEARKYVVRFMSRFYNQQFKRSTLPEGPKVFDLSLSPRASYKMPSDIIRK